MIENNKVDQFVRDYNEAASDKYRATVEKGELLISVLDRKLKKKGGPEILRTCNRIKDVQEVIKKAKEKGLELELDEIEQNIHDIVGFRIVTTFRHEIYEIAEELKKIPGLNVIKVKDYIKNPKPSGYRSLHLITMIEVYTGESSQVISAEIQIRDVLMDAWSNIEHKMKYKNDSVPASLGSSFTKHAEVLNAFDEEINTYEITERQKNEDPMSNTARVAHNEPVLEQKIES